MTGGSPGVAASATTKNILAVQGSSTRTFYATTASLNGSYETRMFDAANAATTVTINAVWLLCGSGTAVYQDLTKCNAQSWNTAPLINAIDGRIAIIAGAVLPIAIKSGTNGLTKAWKEDILMASLYHPAGTVAADTVWCSAWLNEVASDDSPVKTIVAA